MIDLKYRWRTWAAPKHKDGKIDHHKALTGDDLKKFVDQKLFPYLKKFKADAESPDTITYKIGEIFSELKNKVQSGYNLREVLNRIDELRFRSHAEKHEMPHLYEDKIKNMGNAGRTWSINVADVNTTTYDLSVKNPYKKDETVLRSPKEILMEMKALDKESAEIMKTIEELV